jgi:hypothetical protein
MRTTSEMDELEAKLRAWMDEEVGVQNERGEPIEVKRIERIAELLSINGAGFDVIRCGSGGLDQDEAMEFMQHTSFLAGMVYMYPRTDDILGEELELIWRKQKASSAKGSST